MKITVTAVKDIRVNTADVTDETERAKKRYLQLIEELSIEEGKPRRGWKSAVARRLRVDQSYISRLTNELRFSVGAESIDRACASLRMRREFFYDRRAPNSYKEYLLPQGREPTHAAWREFLDGPFGGDLTEEDRAFLIAVPVPEGMVPTDGWYEGLYHLKHKKLTQAEFERGVRKVNEIDAKLPPRPRGKK